MFVDYISYPRMFITGVKKIKDSKFLSLTFFLMINFSDLIKRQDLTVFDVGANAGQKSKLFSDMFQNSIIHCFEPDPVSFEPLSNCFNLDKPPVLQKSKNPRFL